MTTPAHRRPRTPHVPAVPKANPSVSKSSQAIIPWKKGSYVPMVATSRRTDGSVVTGESFGIEAVIDQRPGMLSVIIPRASRVPIAQTKRYFPIEDHQDMVKVNCYKGEKPVARDNEKLGEFQISGMVRRRRDDAQGIDITFTINRDGVVLVDAIEVENPRNHLKVKLEYRREGLFKSVAKGVAREFIGLLLPVNKR